MMVINIPSKVVTIGVYGFNEEQFFQSLLDAHVDLLCDVRQRRGVRGAKYAFANSKRLQARLELLGIDYIHLKELAPTVDIRNKQKEADKTQGIAKRKRTVLGETFRSAYKEEILQKVDFQELANKLGCHHKIIALFCVEKLPQACHRSLIAQRMAAEWNVKVEDIIP